MLGLAQRGDGQSILLSSIRPDRRFVIQRALRPYVFIAFSAFSGVLFVLPLHLYAQGANVQFLDKALEGVRAARVLQPSSFSPALQSNVDHLINAIKDKKLGQPVSLKQMNLLIQLLRRALTQLPPQPDSPFHLDVLLALDGPNSVTLLMACRTTATAYLFREGPSGLVGSLAINIANIDPILDSLSLEYHRAPPGVTPK